MEPEELSLLAELRGAEIELICADSLHLELSHGEITAGPSLFIYHNLPDSPYTLGTHQMEQTHFPVCYKTTITTATATSHAGRIMLPSWFVIRKIEIWAEKIVNNESPQPSETIVENTILLVPESGRNLLIRPDQNGFIITQDEANIDDALESGRYVIKHILD